jgi:hypothetical protein
MYRMVGSSTGTHALGGPLAKKSERCGHALDVLGALLTITTNGWNEPIYYK